MVIFGNLEYETASNLYIVSINIWISANHINNNMINNDNEIKNNPNVYCTNKI